MTYCTLAQVRTWIQYETGQTPDDTLITELIPDAQAWIDSHCTRTFEASAAANRSFDAKRDVKGAMLYLDRDLASITSVTNGNGVAVTSGEYVTEPRNEAPYYAIRLLNSSGKVWECQSDGDCENAIVVNGIWAYGTSVPADVKRACIRLIAYWVKEREMVGDVERPMQSESGQVMQPASIPKVVIDMLKPYRRLG